jgi:hypothetical protein
LAKFGENGSDAARRIGGNRLMPERVDALPFAKPCNVSQVIYW